MIHELGDTREHSYRDNMKERLEAETADEQRGHLVDEVIVFDGGEQTYYVLMSEGQPECFSIFVNDEEYPHPTFDTSMRGINFYSWVVRTWGEIEKTYLMDAENVVVCRWRSFDPEEA